MKYLLDTDVFSELRPRPNRHRRVLSWLATVNEEDLFTSVIVLGEIRRGIEKIRASDPAFAARLEAWLTALKADFADRALPCAEAFQSLLTIAAVRAFVTGQSLRALIFDEHVRAQTHAA